MKALELKHNLPDAQINIDNFIATMTSVLFLWILFLHRPRGSGHDDCIVCKV